MRHANNTNPRYAKKKILDTLNTNNADMLNIVIPDMLKIKIKDMLGGGTSPDNLHANLEVQMKPGSPFRSPLKPLLDVLPSGQTCHTKHAKQILAST